MVTPIRPIDETGPSLRLYNYRLQSHASVSVSLGLYLVKKLQMVYPNFDKCGRRYLLAANTTYAQYQYHGPVSGLYAHSQRPTFITVEGCRALCGTGTQYYPWKESSATITTWVLPVIGLLLQLPFESNEFWATLWALARWGGSPIAALAYVFWNIKVTSKSAMLVDMSVAYSEVPDEHTEFAQMRDSLYILSVMNQCEYLF